MHKIYRLPTWYRMPSKKSCQKWSRLLISAWYCADFRFWHLAYICFLYPAYIDISAAYIVPISDQYRCAVRVVHRLQVSCVAARNCIHKEQMSPPQHHLDSHEQPPYAELGGIPSRNQPGWKLSNGCLSCVYSPHTLRIIPELLDNNHTRSVTFKIIQRILGIY